MKARLARTKIIDLGSWRSVSICYRLFVVALARWCGSDLRARFFIPMLLLLPWRKPEFPQYGSWFSVSALAYAGWCCTTSVLCGAALHSAIKFGGM